MNPQNTQTDKENLQKPLDDLSDLGSRPKNLVDDVHQKLDKASEKVHEVEGRLQHKGQELKEKAENYSGAIYEKGESKVEKHEGQEGGKAGLEGKKEKIFNLANKWVDEVLNAEHTSFEPKMHEIKEKIYHKLDDIRGDAHHKKEELLSKQPEIQERVAEVSSQINKKIDDIREEAHNEKEELLSKHPEIKEKASHLSSQIHHAGEEIKSNLKPKEQGNAEHPTLADQFAQGLQTMTNSISHGLEGMKTAFQTTKGNITSTDRQGELDQEEAQPLTGKPASRKGSDAYGPHNQTLKEKMQEGLHTLGSILSHGVETVKRKLSSAQEPQIVRRKTITLEDEEDNDKVYHVGEEFREVIAGFSKTVDEDWQEERVDELSKAGVHENPFEPFGKKDINIPNADEVHHETWVNREDIAPFIKGDELVFMTQGISSSKCENWSKGLSQRARRDIENIDRQLDKVISGKEREERGEKYQGFKDITNEIAGKKSEGEITKKVNQGVEYNDKMLDKVIREGGKLESEDKENLGGKKKGKIGSEKMSLGQGENIVNATQNV